MNSQGRKPEELIKLQEELRSLENELENPRKIRFKIPDNRFETNYLQLYSKKIC